MIQIKAIKLDINYNILLVSFTLLTTIFIDYIKMCKLAENKDFIYFYERKRLENFVVF